MGVGDFMGRGVVAREEKVVAWGRGDFNRRWGGSKGKRVTAMEMVVPREEG